MGLILGISLPTTGGGDEKIWCFSDDGEFSVKMAYMLGISVDPESFELMWPRLRSSKTMLKVKHFCWWGCSRILSCKAQLKRHHCLDDDTCPRFGKESETLRARNCGV